MTPLETRQHLGLNIAEMTRLLNVPRSTWNCWERGEREPDRAAKRLMEIVVLIHDTNPSIYQRWKLSR
jgi:DNA-binding transcriptional regulator YiaG